MLPETILFAKAERSCHRYDRLNRSPIASPVTREAKALALSTNGAAGDGVVKVATFFQANGTAYIVREYLAGDLDASLIKASRRRSDAQLGDILRHVLLPWVACTMGNCCIGISPANIYLRENAGR
jgi:hypothetical protein